MFNLENTIKTWKRQLRRNPAFEDGDIAELESHLREEIERLKAEGLSKKKAFQKASEEIGEPESLGQELYKTRTTKIDATPSWRKASWMPAMLNNYFKVARRNLIQNKLYTGINILGLSTGIICCLLIYLFVQNELNYDKFHENGDRIYRVVRVMDADTDPRLVGLTSSPFRAAIINDFPETVEEATRLSPGDGLVRVNGEKFRENRFFTADANFFNVFSWPLISGDPQTVLSRPNTVVLSEATAQKYFGSENPVGQTIQVGVGDTEFEVTGVFGKPKNAHSHIEFDLLASMVTYRNALFYNDWWANKLHTYIMLPPNADPESLEKHFPGFMEKYFGEDMARQNRRIDLDLQPLTDIYFANETTFDWQISHGNKTVIYMFGIIAFLIILVACVNFINMATARSVNRAREIGIRKTLGAQRFNLTIRFLGEALMITLAAGLISFGAVYSLLPWFEQLIGNQITIELFSVEVVVLTAIFSIVVGLLAGSYPAIFLSSFQPIKALKEKINFGTSQMVVRKGLIVFQFAVSSLLIIGTIIVNSQLHYVADKSLGFQPDQLLNISINNDDIESHLKTFQQQIEGLAGIATSSVMSGVPGGFFDNHRFRAGENWDETHELKSLYTDYNFTEVLDIKMLAGRDFDASYATDSTDAVVINKTAAELFGWTPEEALGKRFEDQFTDSTARQVIGVVEDFHYQSLHQPIAPLVVSMHPDQRQILVKVDPGHLDEALASLEGVWNEFSPLYPIEYFFLDQRFAQLYESDRRQRSVFAGFSVIAILLACMGLFSLAAFNAEKRSKEMGIRKVLGATFSDILFLFNKEVIIVVGIAFLLAIPATYLLAEQWLQGYAYRIPNGVSNYVWAGVIILGLSIITVSYQSIKVALINPVNSLKSE